MYHTKPKWHQMAPQHEDEGLRGVTVTPHTAQKPNRPCQAATTECGAQLWEGRHWTRNTAKPPSSVRSAHYGHMVEEGVCWRVVVDPSIGVGAMGAIL
eukprot:NODE_5948_length_380_cov_28.555891_g5235_i0.p1 GENE.NODE_5948_length_380_cov_28.555891_g5235_i0~~NODE_5948_length_380_cov_28.555891_g5235_i0.p1  ORF type:complete len:98 (-),score=1.51 NODE_5948_length_380_cov_28.555891_g5235_i0:6-299(-)